MPLVTACMLTGKSPARERYARAAVRCFLDQTYPERDLVILNHGDFEVLSGELMSLADEAGVQVTEYRTRKLDMGSMREACRKRAEGDYCIQWDDDDISLPLRIEMQLGLVTAGKVQATFLKSIINWSAVTNCARVGVNFKNKDYGIDGTVAFNNRIGLLYTPAPERKEDVAFRGRVQKFKAIDGDLLYVRVHHGDNIMPESLIMRHLHGMRNRWDLSADQQAILRSAVLRYHPWSADLMSTGAVGAAG